MNPRRPSVLRPLPCIVCLASALLSAPGLALQSDRHAPIDVQADYANAVLEANSQSRLRGNVRITQGSLQLDADEAEITRRDSAMTRVVFTGTPARVEQRLDSGGQMRARAGNIDYDMTGEMLVLTGDVVVTQPEGELRGERIRYNLVNGQIEGGGNGGRVHMRIEPRNAPPAN